MDRILSMTLFSAVTRRLEWETCPEAVKRVWALLAVLQELLGLLLALLSGDLSAKDVRGRIQVLQQPDPDESAMALDEQERSDSPVSPSESHDSESTVDDSDRNMMSAVRVLCKTIVQGDIKTVSRMLEAAPRLVQKRHEGGWFPIHAAILSGDVDIVRMLLAHPKVDVNSVYSEVTGSNNPDWRESELGTSVDGTSGATPLHYACLVGDLAMIRVLLEDGAFFKARDDKKREPIEYFNIQQDLEAIASFNAMLDDWKRRDAHYTEITKLDDLAQLIRENKFDVFERSLKRNPQAASKMTYYDFTLLHLAVILRRRQFVDLLIATDNSLVNKLDWRSNWSSEGALLSFAPPTVPHRHVKDATPLHYACLVEDVEIVRTLLEAGADWTKKDGRGRVPEDLLYTMSEKYEELKNMLVQYQDAKRERERKAELEKAMEVDLLPPPPPLDPSPNEEHDSQDDESDNSDTEDEDEDDDDDDDDDDDGMDTDNSMKVPSKVSMNALLSLEKVLGEKIVGQRGPIRVVANAIRLRESGWVDPNRPLTLLFLGSSGVGKTELAKQLALYIHGKDGLATNKGENIDKLEKNHGFVRIDMSEFQEHHTALNLFGAPKSYVGYEDGGALTQPLKKNPKAVVLLDEIEKAHPDVLNTFLQVFDDGRITDSKSGVVSCKDAIFIMTSNLGSDMIKAEAPTLRQLVAVTEEQQRHESYLQLTREFTRSLRPVLKQALKRDEFVGRINDIVIFLPLSDEEIMMVVQRELDMWRKRTLEKHKIILSWTGSVVVKLAKAYDVNYGVRSVANEVQRIAMHLVADAHIRGHISDSWQATLKTNEDGDVVMEACDEGKDKDQSKDKE